MTQYWIQVKDANWDCWVAQEDLHGTTVAVIAFWGSEQRTYGGSDEPGDKPNGAPLIILTRDRTAGEGMPHASGQLGIQSGLLPTEGVVRVVLHDGNEGALVNENRFLCKALADALGKDPRVQFISQSNTAGWLNRKDHITPEARYTGACVAKHLLKGPGELADRVKKAGEWLAQLENCWDLYED